VGLLDATAIVVRLPVHAYTGHVVETTALTASGDAIDDELVIAFVARALVDRRGRRTPQSSPKRS
jgi:hypothetical protein